MINGLTFQQTGLRTLIALVVVAGLLTGCSTRTSAQSSADVDTIVRSVFPSATNVQWHERADLGLTTVSYVVPATYPSRAVYEHYRRLLERLGWRPRSANSGPTWECFVDARRKGTPTIHQLLALWDSPDQSQTAFLALEYSTPQNEPAAGCQVGPMGDRQHVVLQVNPYVAPAGE